MRYWNDRPAPRWLIVTASLFIHGIFDLAIALLLAGAIALIAPGLSIWRLVPALLAFKLYIRSFLTPKS